jgi:FkbM family methyltransferase
MPVGARVYAVEPSPGSFEILRDCARVNDAPAAIIPIQAALGDTGGVARLHVDSPTAATNHLTRDANARSGIEVRVLTLDALCAEHALRPGAVKIDVEGWELRVLNGGQDTLRAIRPVIVLELHWGGETDLQPRDILVVARDLNYRLLDGTGAAVDDESRLLRQNFVVMRPAEE